MKLALSPWFRDNLGPDAVAALRDAPNTEHFRIKGEGGGDGYAATLLSLNEKGWVTGVIANERGHATAAACIEALLARVRELAA